MIDLTIIKQRHVIGMYVSDEEYIEAFDRAISAESKLKDSDISAKKLQDCCIDLDKKLYAAESERDDLHRINLELSAITADVQYLQDMLAVCSSERDELKAKLAEMEDTSSRWEKLYISEVRMGAGMAERLIELKKSLAGLSQPIANNSEPDQRITEQDAREWMGSAIDLLNDYVPNPKPFTDIGRTLLAKLNEHREPVGAANNKPVGHQWRKRLYVGMYQGEQMHEWSIWEAVQPPYMDAMQLAVSDTENYQIRPVFAEAVTANKAEAPEGYSLVSNDLINFLSGSRDLNGVWFGEKKDNMGAYWWRKLLPRYADNFDSPLPPLKDGE